MSKNKDFFQDSPYFFDGDDIDKILDLPQIFTARSEKDKNGIIRALISWRFFVPLIMMLTAAALAIVIFLIAVTDSRAGMAQAPVFSEREEDWRGAFVSKETYEACLECSVGLRVGKGSSQREWSGVIISSDGWIVTSARMLGNGDEGKIYVSFGDGKEYGVDSFLQSGEVALLKIEAKDLLAAELSDKALQSGESVLSVSAGEDILCGTVASADESPKFNILSPDEGNGAPVFNMDGYLVGIALGDEQDGKSAVFPSCSVKEIRDLIDKIKNK